jgi:hypothetical protein
MHTTAGIERQVEFVLEARADYICYVDEHGPRSPGARARRKSLLRAEKKLLDMTRKIIANPDWKRRSLSAFLFVMSSRDAGRVRYLIGMWTEICVRFASKRC